MGDMEIEDVKKEDTEIEDTEIEDAEAASVGAVSSREGSFFQALGLPIRVMAAEETELYREAAAFMREAPAWPQEGSVQRMGEAIVVKLSD